MGSVVVPCGALNIIHCNHCHKLHHSGINTDTPFGQTRGEVRWDSFTRVLSAILRVELWIVLPCFHHLHLPRHHWGSTLEASIPLHTEHAPSCADPYWHRTTLSTSISGSGTWLRVWLCGWGSRVAVRCSCDPTRAGISGSRGAEGKWATRHRC